MTEVVNGMANGAGNRGPRLPLLPDGGRLVGVSLSDGPGRPAAIWAGSLWKLLEIVDEWCASRLQDADASCVTTPVTPLLPPIVLGHKTRLPRLPQYDAAGTDH